MSYGYPGAPDQYGQAPGFGSAPGSMGPPGMNGAPGLPQTPVNGQGFPPKPSNMPNINFNAPVIRLGTSGPPNNAPQSGRGRDSNTEPNHNRRGGLGLDRGNDRQQRPDFNLIPPTREEIFRTIFVGNIPDGIGGDAGMERLLRCAGGLRRWTRAIDADDKPCKFGFAEYEDAESLETAAEIFKDIQVPLKKINADATNGDTKMDGEVEKATLLFVVDAASQKYAVEWHEKRQDDETTIQFRLDNARESLENTLKTMFNPPQHGDKDKDGDTAMEDVKQDPVTGEFVTISGAEPEDELADIPAELRETVIAEIKSFRDRSIRRDIERQRKEDEEEMERKERSRREMGLGSGRGTNGIPSGPADRGPIDAPKGPRGPRGSQMPRDYQGNGNFVSASGAKYNYISREEEDSDASDDELETRRKAKRDAVADKAYDDYERTWLIRERNRTNAIEREQRRTEDEDKNSGKRIEAMAERLKTWNEEKTKTELYHTDHSAWQRQRNNFRGREAQQDDADRREEEAETARQQDRVQARDAADAFLDNQVSEVAAEPQRQGVKISFGNALQKTQPAAPKRRTAFEVEGLLDNEDDDSTTKRTLVPINPATLAEAAALTPEERQEAARQLAADIPSDKDGLWNWSVHWDSMTDEVIEEQLKPFVEKKIVEYLGVQEDMLVEVVEGHIREHKGPQELVDELEGPLDEEAEVLVKKLWRMVIFFSESERRGLSA